ncbi:HAD family hydrolase [Tomitella fengzijianii]|uniref:HAD family phosphatase n=1 Tax=Tomitella fengzijianii TaxID=2597660 RepID=A0A516X7X8_9ACTN|nr:HAD family phosphatase [Tomitella fengzijianii]QDQ98741.1 HAD family phosphatase [Tomitella fengzijianii]
MLVDFGGVLTTSVLDSFRAFGAGFGQPDLPARLLSTDDVSRGLISDHEKGVIAAGEFEARFAERLRAHGAEVAAHGLQAGLMAGLRPDEQMLGLVAGLRKAGVPVALVSNAFGHDCYAGVDLDSIADVVVISSDLGVRKPSRKMYAVACERLGVAPEQAVMVDDLQQNLDGAARLGIAGVLHTAADDTRRQLAERFGLTA